MPTIPRGELEQALEQVKGAIAEKAFAPILTHVYIAGRKVLGYDSEIGIQANLSTDLGTPFNVRFAPFMSLVKALEADEVELTVEGKRLTIKSGKHKSSMMMMEEEFPKPSVKGTSWSPVPAGFKEAVERASIAVAEGERNKVLSAVYMNENRVYGTTGTEVVRCTLPELKVTPMLLGAKAIGEIIRLGNPTRVMVSDPWAVWDYTNLTLITRLREGAKEYPPVDKLFERHKFTPGPIPDGLGSALTRLAVFADTSDGRVVLSHNAFGRTLEARGEIGEVVEHFDPAGEPIETKAFNPQKLLAALPFSDGFEWGGPTDPVYLCGAASGFEYLLAPMRL